jgi:hypothetical protein
MTLVTPVSSFAAGGWFPTAVWATATRTTPLTPREATAAEKSNSIAEVGAAERPLPERKRPFVAATRKTIGTVVPTAWHYYKQPAYNLWCLPVGRPTRARIKNR